MKYDIQEIYQWVIGGLIAFIGMLLLIIKDFIFGIFKSKEKKINERLDRLEIKVDKLEINFDKLNERMEDSNIIQNKMFIKMREIKHELKNRAEQDKRINEIILSKLLKNE